jgi:hypothetical protein
LAWSDIIKEYMNGVWKNTMKRFRHVGRGIAKDEKVAKTSKAVVEITSNFNLCVD